MPVVETVFEAELPVAERLIIQKNRIEGRPDGPRIAVVTGVHGDELEGQLVAYQLARQLREDIGKLHGIVDIYPAINPLGISSIKRGVPTFDIDLDRTFPGSARGNLTQAMAAAVVDDIRGADVCVDVHASNIFLRELPQIRINERQEAALMPVAPLLNVNFVWVRASTTEGESTLAYALNDAGTPCLVVESGVGMRLTEDYGFRLTEGLLHLIAHFGGWDGGVIEFPPPLVARDDKVELLHADAPGIFLPRAEHGTTVEAGQVIGIICDPLTGTLKSEVRCQTGGLLFTLREYPVVYPGSLVARILGGER